MITDATYLQSVLDRIPHQAPFRFIDGLDWVSASGCQGHFTFLSTADYYKGHYPNFPITPGVLLTECMVQIGVLPLAIHLMDDKSEEGLPMLTAQEVEFIRPLLPPQRATVKGKLIYFRRGIICCACTLYNAQQQEVASGKLTATIKRQ